MKKILFGLIIILFVANVAVWQAVFVENRRAGSRELTVAFLDIGQGDAIFIEAPNGNQVLVDGGPNAKVLAELGKLMPWYDKSLDMIVVTNPDKDHIAGFVDILKRYKVEYLLEPGTENKSLTHQVVQELVGSKGVEKITARRGLKIFLDSRPGREVVLTVLFPDHDVSKEKTNDGSIVMRLTYGETEVMLTGDAPSSVERRLLSLVDNEPSDVGLMPDETRPDLALESDILKVGHHGSKTSTSEEFVKAVSPKFAVISSGKENKYGHPNEETLATLTKFPLEILRTDQIGTVVMKSDGEKFRLSI